MWLCLDQYSSYCRERGSAGYQLYMLIELPVSCSRPSGWPWSQQPGNCLRPCFWVCTRYTHLVITSRSSSLSAHDNIHTDKNCVRLVHLTILWLSIHYSSCMLVYLIDYICIFICIIYTYHVIPSFLYLSFVYLLCHIWDPEFACSDLDPVASPSEEDQEYLGGLAEWQ